MLQRVNGDYGLAVTTDVPRSGEHQGGPFIIATEAPQLGVWDGEIMHPIRAADDSSRTLTQQLVNEFGLIEKVARRLVSEGREAVEEQLAAYPYRKATPQNPAAFLVQAIRERWPLPESYAAERVRQTAVQEQETAGAQQAARYERYATQFQVYQDEQLAALSRAYPDKWEAFLLDTETRRQHMLQSSDEEMRKVAADSAAMQRYNGWLFFSYDETTRYADFDEWLARQSDQQAKGD